ncbi:MAG TPA: hypothetical protein VHC69_30285 [Polyangiaceae bacterium]|nr:hypothetical protein [Polyangiaceae bacterium]
MSAHGTTPRVAAISLVVVATACSANSGGSNKITASDTGGASAAPPASTGGATTGAGGTGFTAPMNTSVLTVPPATGGTPPMTPTPTSTVQTSGPPPPLAIDECSPTNSAGIDAAATQALMAGGSGSTLRWLYPYDGTVFPRGLISPTLMWDGPNADVVYVHLHSSLFDYKGCFKPTGPNQLELPQMIWDQASDRTGGASDPFLVELTASSGGAAAGPISEHVVVAKATLKGSIYYNSYTTKLLSGGLLPGSGGAVLRIIPGQNAQVFLGMSGCTGCHSVSANGTRLVSLNLAGLLAGAGATYALAPGQSPNPPALAANAPETSFTGLYPDGSFYVTNAHQGVVGPRAGGPGAIGAPNASVYDTTTGNAITGTDVPQTAMTPAFSADGSFLAFTDYAIDMGRGIAMMAFDGAAKKASAYKKVWEADAGNYAAWPFILPDDKGIVCAVGPNADFSGGGIGLSGGAALNALAPVSDLFLLDVATGTSTLLARAMGFDTPQDAANGTTYLPFPAAEETHHNYYPTVSPVAAGGYFWVFFDSYRHYGNLGVQRQLWGAAVDVSADGTYKTDPSHPAFYLTGQELGTGNHRAFTALDPCRKDGDSCTTGIDCCNGFCTNGKCGPPPPPPDGGPRCAGTDESCSSAIPCCNPRDECIAGHCGTLVR